MPIIKSAIKKMRQARVKQARNKLVKLSLKSILDAFKKSPTASSYSKLASKLDKAAKKNVIHKNKAGRLKSRLAKLLSGEVKKKTLVTKKK